MASTVTVTLKDKDGVQVSVHEITVESSIPEVFVENGTPYILRRIMTGKKDAIATAPSDIYSFDTQQAVEASSLKIAANE